MSKDSTLVYACSATVLLRSSCKMHYENLGSSWMLGRSLSDSNKLLRIFNEFQCQGTNFIQFMTTGYRARNWSIFDRSMVPFEPVGTWYYQEQKMLNPLAGGGRYKLVQITSHSHEQKTIKPLAGGGREWLTTKAIEFEMSCSFTR